MAAVPRYSGPFRTREAERLLWRAGFGPRRGQAASLAGLGLDGAVRSLTHPPGERWIGPPPTMTRAAPSHPPTHTAMTTSGGSTGWFVHAGRSWSA